LIKNNFFGNFILAARPLELPQAKWFGLRLARSIARTGYREIFITIDNVLLCYKLKATDQYTAILKV